MKTKPPITIDELPDIERETLEIARDNIAAMEKVVRPTLAQEVKRVWIAKLAAKGVSAEDALEILEAMPELDDLRRLIKRMQRLIKKNDEIVGEVRVTEAGEGDRP